MLINYNADCCLRWMVGWLVLLPSILWDGWRCYGGMVMQLARGGFSPFSSHNYLISYLIEWQLCIPTEYTNRISKRIARLMNHLSSGFFQRGGHPSHLLPKALLELVARHRRKSLRLCGILSEFAHPWIALPFAQFSFCCCVFLLLLSFGRR